MVRNGENKNKCNTRLMRPGLSAAGAKVSILMSIDTVKTSSVHDDCSSQQDSVSSIFVHLDRVARMTNRTRPFPQLIYSR